MNKEAFLEWLRQQPAEREFDYGDIDRCLLAAFMNETNPGQLFCVGGISYSRVTKDGRRVRVGEYMEIPEWARCLSTSLVRNHNRFTVAQVRANLNA